MMFQKVNEALRSGVGLSVGYLGVPSRLRVGRVDHIEPQAATFKHIGHNLLVRISNCFRKHLAEFGSGEGPPHIALVGLAAITAK